MEIGISPRLARGFAFVSTKAVFVRKRIRTSVNEKAEFDGATAFKLAHSCMSEILSTVE
ncbi:MAG: hypothetical protein IJ292_00600 [Clostridia bacterium]|nr:hypothetical protein [Clostridia bacterium]